MRAKVKLFWELSPSDDVVSQELEVHVRGEDDSVHQDLVETLENFVTSYEFVAHEKDSVNVSLKANDGTSLSEAAVLEFNIGDLTSPLAPTGLGYEIVELLPDEEPVDPEVEFNEGE